jgi:hypothetical protein
MTYKVGDKVELLDNAYLVPAGTVGTVVKVWSDDLFGVDGVFAEPLDFFPTEIKPYVEPLKVGDRVELLSVEPYESLWVGQRGVIDRESVPGQMYSVVVDGRRCGLSFAPEQLKRVEPAKPKKVDVTVTSTLITQIDEALKQAGTAVDPHQQLEIERAHLATAQRAIETLRLEKEQALRREDYWRQRASALASSKETYRRRTKRTRVERDELQRRVEVLEGDRQTYREQVRYWEAATHRARDVNSKLSTELKMLKALCSSSEGSDVVLPLIEELAKAAVS